MVVESSASSRFLLVAAAAFALFAAAGCDPTPVGPPGTTCSSTLPCEDGLTCVDGTCSAGCVADGCERGFCNEATGACVECRTTEDCSAGQVCSESNTCSLVIAACSDDSDCDRGFCDVAVGSCVDCRTDTDCGPGEGCDELTRSCVRQTGCDSDVDCTTPTAVCDLTENVCVECVADDDCTSGSCDAITNTCIARCDDGDETEPNDGAQAAALASGEEHAGRICAGDVDEFVFAAEGTIDATLVTDAGLTLTLLNSAGTTLASDDGSVSFADAPVGNYRLRIQGAAGVEADYALNLTITPPSVCIELDNETNNTPATAQLLPTTGSLRSGTICGADVDLWSFATTAGDDVTVTLAAGDGEGVPTFTLENASGSVLANGTAATPATIDNAVGGTVFVRVRATGGDIGYSVRATTSAAPPVCSQTDAEPNDTADAAIAISSGAQRTGQICGADVDQYRFTANALDDVALTVTGSNISLRILNSAGGVVAEGTGTLNAADLAAGNYRVEVRGVLSSTEAAYGFTLTVTPEPAADPCLEGGLEPDSATAPRTLPTDGSIASGRICASDTDFFRFTVAATRTVSISTQFTDANGDLDIRLRDGTGTQVTTSTGTSDEELIVRSLAAGSYTVEVFGFSGAINTYTIAVTAAAGVCVDDALEPNDAVGRAPPISGRVVNAVRCPTNDDFFAIALETGDTLDARLGGAGLTMSLLSTSGTLLQADAADGANRRLQVSSLAAGRYVIRVTGSGVNETSYTLTPTIIPSTTRCIDDGAEANDTNATPFTIDTTFLADGSYDLTGLTLCPGDTDVFAVDVAAGRTVRVDLAHVTTFDLDVEALEQRGTSGLFRSLASAIGLDGTLDVVAGNINAATRLLLRVGEFDAPDEGVAYVLGVELGDIVDNGSCINDRFDTWTSTATSGLRTHNNNGRTDPTVDTVIVAPTSLSPPETLPSMQICAGTDNSSSTDDDLDVYAVVLTAGQRLSATVTYAHRLGGDIDIRAFGPDNTNAPADSDSQVDLLSCTSCAGFSGTETFSFTATVSGTHFIEVFGFNDSVNSYQIATTVE
jgi:hypothetical protein